MKNVNLIFGTINVKGFRQFIFSVIFFFIHVNKQTIKDLLHKNIV